MRFVLRVLWLGLVFVLAQAPSAQDIASSLKRLPHVSAVRQTSQPGAVLATYVITFEQPVDQANPSGPKFDQQVYLAHTGFENDVILGTEGYAARGPSGGELARILSTPNRITVEHRYFGGSIPSPLVWEHLTVKNSAADLHRIVTSFKQLYKGKWVATGVSKGGQTALFYKCFYPNDVDATVAYVAPINLHQEDPRIGRLMETIGTEEVRAKIKACQLAMLKRQDEVLAVLKPDAARFSLGVGKAFEYSVLEFPYAFWQFGASPEILPGPDASAETLAQPMRQLNVMFYYSDPGIKQFEAFMYQAFSEIGYYNYDLTDFKPFLKHLKDPTNRDLCPPGTRDTVTYKPETMAFIYNFLAYKADRVIYVYGETDTWSATAMQLMGRTDAVKIMVKGAAHNARIGLASETQRAAVYDALERWLGKAVNRRQAVSVDLTGSGPGANYKSVD